MGSPRQVWARRPADEDEAKALASSLRLQILRLALHEPRTNKELATALGRNPASVLHHVRTLVDTGFLIEQPVRRGVRGAREVPYLSSAKSWYLDSEARALPPAPGRGVGHDLLLQTFLEEIRRADPTRTRTARLGFRLSARDREEVLDRLQALLEDLASRPSDPEGEPWGLFFATHPES